MEGKTAACAHLSPVGNVAAACADLWSNESVQNVKLLAAMAPTVYLEQLEYDTRLLNAALREGRPAVLQLQRLLVESDIHFDPQAYVLAPENVIRISREIVRGENRVDATRRGCLTALTLIEEGQRDGRLERDPREEGWLGRLRAELESIPSEEGQFVEQMLPQPRYRQGPALGVRPVAPGPTPSRAPQAAIDLRYSSAPWGSGEKWLAPIF